jgi:hypothetical protein
MIKKCKNFTAEKEFWGDQNYNLPIPRPPLRTSKYQKKPSALKGENIHHFNT